MTSQGYSQSQRWKPGDWKCSACCGHNFASRSDCFRCHLSKAFAGEEMDPRYQSAGTHNQGWKPGDWGCDNCSAHNFAMRQVCYQCGVSKAAAKDTVDTKMKRALVMDYVTRLTKKMKPSDNENHMHMNPTNPVRKNGKQVLKKLKKNHAEEGKAEKRVFREASPKKQHRRRYRSRTHSRGRSRTRSRTHSNRRSRSRRRTYHH